MGDTMFFVIFIAVMIRFFYLFTRSKGNQQEEDGETQEKHGLVHDWHNEWQWRHLHDPSDVRNITNPDNPAYDAFTDRYLFIK